jgi:hypothetical protein
VKCPECAIDDIALAAWRTVGGMLPAKRCSRVHGKPCKECKTVLTRNPSKRCDSCFNEWWKADRGFGEEVKVKEDD